MTQRDQAIQAIRDFAFWNYGLNDTDPNDKYAEWVPDLADKVVAALAQPATARASVMSWDSGEQPDLDRLAEILHDLSDGAVHLASVDTGMNEYAVVVSTVPLDKAGVQSTFERWWAPEGDGDRPDVLEINETGEAA